MKGKRKIILAACILCFFISLPTSIFAQQPDPFAEVFFSPELIMQNQQAIGLSEEQKTFIISQIQEAQQTFTKLNWSLQKGNGNSCHAYKSEYGR